MTPDDPLVNAVSALYAQFGKNIYPAILKIWINQLEPFGHDAVREILQSLEDAICGEIQRMPSPNDIKKRLGVCVPHDKRTMAVLTAGEIMKSVHRYGWNNAKEARAALSPLAWRIVQDSGGWISLCESLTNENKTIYVKQWIDRAMAIQEINDGKGQKSVQKVLPEPRGENRALPPGVGDKMDVRVFSLPDKIREKKAVLSRER